MRMRAASTPAGLRITIAGGNPETTDSAAEIFGLQGFHVARAYGGDAAAVSFALARCSPWQPGKRGSTQ